MIDTQASQKTKINYQEPREKKIKSDTFLYTLHKKINFREIKSYM